MACFLPGQRRGRRRAQWPRALAASACRLAYGASVERLRGARVARVKLAESVQLLLRHRQRLVQYKPAYAFAAGRGRERAFEFVVTPFGWQELRRIQRGSLDRALRTLFAGHVREDWRQHRVGFPNVKEHRDHGEL